MVDASIYVIYSNMPPQTRALWGRSVDATQALLIPDAEYSILNKRWLRFKFKPMTFVTLTSDSMSMNQLNQKLKLMVDAP